MEVRPLKSPKKPWRAVVDKDLVDLDGENSGETADGRDVAGNALMWVHDRPVKANVVDVERVAKASWKIAVFMVWITFCG
jgi:hypothetical protein